MTKPPHVSEASHDLLEAPQRTDASADEHGDVNAGLRALVDTRQCASMAHADAYDFVAVGGGTAGLVATAGMALLGARVAIVERGLLGGDCLVSGCVPSKALLHAAKVAHTARSARTVGIDTGQVRVDFGAVMHRIREVRAQIAQTDSVAAARARGVDVIHGQAVFSGRNTLVVQGRTIRFKRALIATGSRPAVPEIPGLAEANPLTSESVFELTRAPSRLTIVGGGAMGCEIAQAMQRLGVEVTLLERGPRLLPAEDPDAAQLIDDALRADGVRVVLEASLTRVTDEGSACEVHVTTEDVSLRVATDRILLATGRIANVQQLGLAEAGVRHDAAGIAVDRRFRTSNRRIYAAGDVVGGRGSTHGAWAQAEYAVLNAFFPLRLNVARRIVPRALYTDPELGHIGPDVAELHRDVDILTVPMSNNDRAHIEGERVGFARVYLRRGSDAIVAATIVGRGASELLAALSHAMTQRTGLAKLARAVVPYPTRAEVLRDLAYEYSMRRAKAARPWAQAWLRWVR